MKIVPFDPPQSDHHMLNTGLSTEGGVTAKGLVDGLNVYLAQLFAELSAMQPVLGGLVSASRSQQIGIALEQTSSTASSTPQASTLAEDLEDAEADLSALRKGGGDMIISDERMMGRLETAAEAVKRVQGDLATKLASMGKPPSPGDTPDPPRSSLADVLAGISR